MNKNIQFIKRLKWNYILLFLLTSAFQISTYGQVYNDGRIRLRVWVNKVWSDANCSEIGNQNYAWVGTQLRVPFNTSGAYDYSTIFDCRADGQEARYFDKTMYADQRANGAANETNGYKVFDKTYTNDNVPYYFEWISNAWENDCPNSIGCGGSVWDFGSCCLFNAESDDDFSTKNNWTSNPCYFRGGPDGAVQYFHTNKMYSNEGDGDGFAVVFAYQWDWVDAVAPTCSSPKYSDGPITLTVDLDGVWCDNDYDWGSDCIAGSADDEDLRMDYKVWDNLTSEPGSFSNGPQGNIANPSWDYSFPFTSFLNKTYANGTNNMETFSTKIQVWEEDGCGGDEDYNTGCFLGVADDDAFAGPITTTVNWRNSPPNTDNFIDVPIRQGTGSHNNWTVRLKYKWTISNPSITAVSGTRDLVYCIGSTAATLTATSTNCTYYQWQVSNVTSPPTGTGDNSCPTTGWSDIAGANCEAYAPPQVAGTRVYRLKGFNRNGNGSKSSSGTRYAETYSPCTRITYWGPYLPPISGSINCGSSLQPGTTVTLSIPTAPDVNAAVNYSSITWTVSPATGVTNSAPTSTSTNITFPLTPIGTTYTVTLTINRTSCSNSVQTCTYKVVEPACNYIYVSPSGNDANSGGPAEPVATFGQAMALAGGSRLHIRMEKGTTYTQGSIVAMKANVIIEGGFTKSGSVWTKNIGGGIPGNANETKITFNGTGGTGGSGIEYVLGIQANAVNNWRLQDLVIRTANASGTSASRGKSVMAIWIKNCTGFEILACNVLAGNATAGLPGAFVQDGYSTSNGNGGGAGSCDGGNGGGGGSSSNAGSGIRMGGGGGAGGQGAPEHWNCWNCGSWGGSNGTNGGGGAAGGTTGGAGGTGRTDCGCNNGGGGANGANGTAGTAGSDGTTTAENGDYYIPGGQQPTGQDGGGGGGGKGGGGSSGQYGSVISCDDGGGNGGGSGGVGAYGGAGGTGGYGGGGSFALYIIANGAASTGSYSQSTFTGGTLGGGGGGGGGGLGKTGGSGGYGNTNCSGEICSAGNGGKGGNSGAGGRGGNGAPGKSIGIGIYQNGSTVTFTNNGGTIPTVAVTSQYNYGCTYSEINLVNTAAPTWSSLGSGGAYLDNLSSGVSGYSSTVDNIYTYYTTTGIKDIATSSSPGTYAKYVYIDGTRSMPTIYYTPTDLTICTGEAISFNCKTNNLNDSTGYDWCIQRISSPNSTTVPGACVFTSNDHTPGSFTFTNAQTITETYQVKLRVRDECCGWSRPQYLSVTVYPVILNNTITAPATVDFCGSGDPANIVGSTPTGGSGAYTYIWQVSTDLGVNWAATGITTQSYDPGNITVVGTYLYRRIVNSNNCSNTSDSIIINIYPALDGNSIEATVKIYCAANGSSVNFDVVEGSSPSGGNGTYTYLWQTNNNGAGWVNGSGTNNLIDYDPAAATITSPGTYYFRRQVTATVCGSSLYSNEDSIKVYPAPVNPITANVDTNNICDGRPGVISLTLTGGSGTQAYWYTGSCGGTLIGYGTALNGFFQVPNPTTTTTYYGRWADLCGNLSSSCASVTLTVIDCVCGDTGLVTYLANNKSVTLNELCTESGWTYFYGTSDGKNKTYFAINKTPGGAGYNTNTITLVGTLTTSQDPSSSNYLWSQEDLTYKEFNVASGRYWNATVSSGTLNGKVKVRFYFPSSDLTAITTKATAWKTTNSGLGPFNTSDYLWFKTNDGSAYSPATDVEADRINGGRSTYLIPSGSSSSSGTERGQNYVEFDVQSFSGGSVAIRVSNDDPVLPIELLSFLGWNVGAYNHLEWVTASEFNNDYFVVERSLNAQNFDAIGIVDAVGNSQINTTYNFIDSIPNIGINYYRLKQVDVDGTFKYSKTIAIERNQGNTFNSAIVGYRPNPTTDKFFVDLQINKPSKFNVRVTNALGQVVHDRVVSYDKGFNTFTLNSNEFASGAYLIEFFEVNTNERYEVKFVKQ